MLTFGPSRTFTSLRQTPVLQAPVLVRRLSLELWTLLYDFSEEKSCSEVGLGCEFVAPARVSRLASGGCRIGGGFLPWVESFSYRLLEVLTIFIRGQVDRGPRKSSCASFGRQPSRSWISVQRSFQQSTCELPSPSSRGSDVGKQFCRLTCVRYPLGQTPATYHHVSCRLASGGRLSRCFLESCTSPQKLFLKLWSK